MDPTLTPAAPLAGRTIVVTRSREQASALSMRLRGLGATVIEIPTIAIVPPADYAPLDGALASLPTYDCLIVTSANTARVLAERLAGRAPADGLQPHTVAVGPATAEALRSAGLRVDLVPDAAIAESIVAALGRWVSRKKVLLVRAEVARDLLPTALEQAGAILTVVDAYRTVLAEDSLPLVAEAFGLSDEGGVGPRVDALTFTSSSTVKNLLALLGKAALTVPATAKLFSIGPITSATMQEQGLEPDGEAARHDVAGLVEAVVQGLA